MASLRKKQGEKLDAASIQKVIELLNSEQPISKKEACEILNISYNTTRLNKIINDHTEREEYRAKRRKELAKHPVSEREKAEIITYYLHSFSLSAVSESTFRSTEVIKRVLKEFSIPLKDSSYTYHNPPLLEETSYAVDYKPGDLVFSAKYYSIAYISKLIKTDEITSYYRIYIIGVNERYAIQPAYELADLRPLQEMGVQPKTMDKNDIVYAINEALIKARKGKSK